MNTTDNSTTIVLSNLVPGTQYNFSVRALTVAFGPFSAQLSVHTADGEDQCKWLGILYVPIAVYIHRRVP